MSCPEKWADAHHDGFRYNWWSLTQSMQHPLSPRYWWVTGAVALLLVLPVFKVLALVARAAAKHRPCTCHPDEAPVPCQKKYAFSECANAVVERRRA